MSQIISPVKLSEVISEAAEMCGDPFFRDYDKEFYALQWLRALRTIAIDYEIFERRLTVAIQEEDIGHEIVIEPLNFVSETKLYVNRIPYEKVNGEVTSGKREYYTRYAVNQFVFDYSDKSIGDTVDIFYKSTVNPAEDYSEGSIIPVLPDKLHEELLKRIVIRVATQGVVNFSNEKAEKYSKVLKLYTAGNKVDPKLGGNNQWTKIKPYQPL